MDIVSEIAKLIKNRREAQVRRLQVDGPQTSIRILCPTRYIKNMFVEWFYQAMHFEGFLNLWRNPLIYCYANLNV